MGPTTRGMRASTSNVKLEDLSEEREEAQQPSQEEADIGHKINTGVSAIEDYMHQLQKTLRSLKKDVTLLQEKNKELQQDLDESREAAENQSQPKRGSKGRATTKQLQAKVDGLRAQVHDLEHKRSRDKRKIAKLQAKELKKDAEDLQDQADIEVGDIAHKMRKLLRKFHDLMAANSIAEDEECPVCLEKMKIGDTVSFTCEHLICRGCVKDLAPIHEDVVRCPNCRKEVQKDELEEVEFTASQQWDALLEVAQTWAKLDIRRQPATSDEEEEENFIDDEDGTSETEHDSPESKPKIDRPQLTDTSSPPPVPSKGRLKRRARATSVASSVPGEQEIELQGGENHEPEQANQAQGDQELSNQEQANEDPAEESQGTDGRISTPTPESGGSQAGEPLTPGYSQSPIAEKRRRLQELAESRLKRRRL